MAEALEERIEALLQQGTSRREIGRSLLAESDSRKLLYLVNNLSDPTRRSRYQYLNLLLVLLLTFATTKKLIASFAFGSIDLFLLLSLVAPMINLYLLREILRFRRLGYQFLFVLSILSLLLPENHFPLEAGLVLGQIGLSGFLLRRLFPNHQPVESLDEG